MSKILSFKISVYRLATLV